MISDRVVILIILTACMFGFSIYMQEGTWIFPFPLYEIGMLAGIIAVYIAEKQALQLPGYLALLWGILQVFTSQFFWEFFIGDQFMETFYESAITDYFQVACWIVFLVWGIVVSLRSEKAVIGIILVLATVVCLLLNSYFIAMIPLVAWLIILFFQKPALHRNILVLFVFFHLTEYFSLLWMTGTTG